MEENDDLLVRRKRMNEEGEWEYECRECCEWLPKDRFRGCKTYVDAYGNCLMCSSCRSKKANLKKIKTEEDWKEHILGVLGFYNFPDANAYMEHLKKKHGLKGK
jgi:hypothetical protein